MIGEHAELCGADWLNRPVRLAGDESTTDSVVDYHLEQRGTFREGDVVVVLQCTSPLMTTDDIDGTIRLAQSDKFDSAFAVCPFDGLPYNSTGRALGLPLGHGRRQDKDPTYVVSGGVFGSTIPASGKFMLTHGHKGMHLTTHPYYLEIDEWDDMELAEVLLPLTEKQAKRKLALTT